MKHIIFALLTTALFGVGCDKKEDTVDFTLRFKAQFGGTQLIKNKKYDYDNYQARFSTFHTYLSNIALLNGNDATVLSELEYVNFTPDFAANDSSVIVTVRVKAPAGDYTGLRLGYGVPADMNKKRPSDFKAGHPLALENEYWSGWKSYIFTKIEGDADKDLNGTEDVITLLHFGSDAIYRSVDYVKPLTISENSTVEVSFDLKNMFLVDNQWWDIRLPEKAQTSNDADDITTAAALVKNWMAATTVK